VGKSSLINALTLSAAARSSDVPGKTQATPRTHQPTKP